MFYPEKEEIYLDGRVFINPRIVWEDCVRNMIIVACDNGSGMLIGNIADKFKNELSGGGQNENTTTKS